MRHDFGAGMADYVVRPSDGIWTVAGGAALTFWSAATEGTQYTDLLDAAGLPVTEIVADERGFVPAFQGPDEVVGMWVESGGPSRAYTEARGLVTGEGSGGYTSVTRIVASSTAPADVRAAAQYVCDGIADQVQIQQAFDDARDHGGGEIQLTVGDYNLTEQLRVEGTDDVDVEIGIIVRGQGARATMLNTTSGMASALHLTKVVRVQLCDLGITVGGTTDGITSSTTNGAASGHRSFWNSSFKNLQINGPWDGSHSGWAINMGSPFRSVFENIEIGGVGNGLRFHSEHADFNPGDTTVERCFVELVGDNGTAYKIESTTADGVMNQIEFEMCEAIASGTGCTGIHLAGTGGWGTSHTHWRGVNLEQFDRLVHVEYGSSNTFRLNHVGLRTGASGLTALVFGANAFNNAVLSTGLLYVTDDCKLYSDANTIEPASPNRISNLRAYSEGATVTGSINPAGTTIRRTILGNTTVRSPQEPFVYVPPGWGKRWFAARDGAGSALARIVTVGGSATAGFYASNPRTKSWPGLLASKLQGMYGDGGSGFQSTAMSPAILSGSDATALAAWQVAGAVVGQTGTWVQGGSFFGPSGHYLYTDVTGNTLTFKARGTTVRIYTVVGGTTRPSMLYSIDGGADVTVAQPTGTNAIQVTTVTGLSNAEHTVVVKAGTASTGQYLSVCGVSGEKTSGVLVHNLAVAGATSARYGTSYLSTGLNATYNGGVDFPADLCIWSAAPNDATANNTADVWSANVARWIRAIRDNSPATGDVDLLFAIPHFGRHEGTNFKYQDYMRAARGLCDVYGAAFINWWGLGLNSWENWNAKGYWGTSAGTGATGTDTVHLSDAGFQYMADTVLPILLG
ncbi:SGNH/GDSL hydrolase family protein [Streptomyces sp. CRN 30]|uniref:SGNH/GDSL hydrolase family protein n=1 Tax=Streptomyces sp. CRN 30 TaxID=3075613 RepID=UPI002A83F19C|nr:SGNH/GDSL hydrolase family protein [Streptomyces sp. CRN 30]